MWKQMRTASVAQPTEARPHRHTSLLHTHPAKHSSTEQHVRCSLPRHYLQSRCDSAARVDEPAVHKDISRVEPSVSRLLHKNRDTKNSNRPAPSDCGFLQLGQLTSPAGLQEVWQQQIRPACLHTWQELQHFAAKEAAFSLRQSIQSHTNLDYLCPHADGEQKPLLYLQELDMLLGSIQQVLLICSFTREHHRHTDWRHTATAVFIDARTLEQDVCSCKLLQQGLLLAGQQLLQSPAAASSLITSVAVLPRDPHIDYHSTADLLQLIKALKYHMRLEGLNPNSFAGLHASNPAGQSTEAQVLTADEQRSILSDLHAEHKLLLNRMQSLLLSPDAAPVIQMDKQSYDVLMQPLLGSEYSRMRLATAVTAATAGQHVACHDTTAPEQDAANTASAAEAASEQDVDVVLDLQLVSQLLKQHPDADVRADIWSAGLLQRLDKLLLVWKDLADTRLKIARSQGFASYAELMLQHSLLGSPEAATAVCQQLAAALQPAAIAAMHAMPQQQQQEPPHAAPLSSTNIIASDAEHDLHQALFGLIDQDDLQQLQPFLQLPQVMSGFSNLLEASFDLSLQQRRASDGEVWNDSILVYDLCEVGTAADKQQQLAAERTSKVTAGKHLGTIYLDLSAGYSAQLLLYGTSYSVLGYKASEQHQVPPENGFGVVNGKPWGAVQCAVALGLQSQGVLGGTHAQLALGLWELCHELGHAVNFILSAATGSSQHPMLRRRPSEQGKGGVHSKASVYSSIGAAAAQPQLYHLHAAWQPLELLELPSTLFESFCMDPLCMRVLCRHCDTKEPLPLELSERLAKFMRLSHYHPVHHQHVVLAMLYDLEMASITSRQLGRHAAHVAWQENMSSEGLAAMPGSQVSLQQVASLPRLLTSSGQGYGYAVAWCLTQLLQPSLMQHVHRRLDPAATCSGAGDQENMKNCTASRPGSQLWKDFLAAGCSLCDVKTLVSCIVKLQQKADNGTSEAEHKQCRMQRLGDKGPVALYLDLASALEEHGLWPLPESSEEDVDLLIVCFLTALQAVKSRGFF